MAPPSTKPKLRKISVKAGSNAFGTTWRLRISRSGTPFDRAVSTKSSCVASIIAERITIAYPPM